MTSVTDSDTTKQKALEEAVEEKCRLIRKMMDKVESNMKIICMHSTRIEQTGHYAKKMVGLRGHQLKLQRKAMQFQANVKNEDLPEFIESSGMREGAFKDIDKLINEHLNNLGIVVETLEETTDRCLGECNNTFQLIADEFMQGDPHALYRSGIAESFRKCIEVTDTLVQLSNFQEDKVDTTIDRTLDSKNGKGKTQGQHSSSSSEPFVLPSDNEDDEEVEDESIETLLSSDKKQRTRAQSLNTDKAVEVEQVEKDAPKPVAKIETTPGVDFPSNVEKVSHRQRRPYTPPGGTSQAREVNTGGGQLASLDRDMGNFDDDTDEADGASEYEPNIKRPRYDDSEEAEASFSQDQDRHPNIAYVSKDESRSMGKNKHKRKNDSIGTNGTTVDLT